MVLPFKLFELTEPLSLEEIAHRIKGFRLEEVAEVGNREVELGSRVRELGRQGEALRGVFEESFLVTLKYRGEEYKVPISVETVFEFYPYTDRMMLTVAAKKARANRVAAQLSSILSARKDAVAEAQITAETLRQLHESRPGATKVIFFDGVRIPGVDKFSLYGEQLADTSLYQEYLKLGNIWYVVFELEENLVVGVTRNCVITIFSKMGLDDGFEVVREKIVPLTTPYSTSER